MRKLCLAVPISRERDFELKKEWWKRPQPLALLMDQQWLCHRSTQSNLGNTIPKLFTALLSFCVHSLEFHCTATGWFSRMSHKIRFCFFLLSLTDCCKLFSWMHAQIFSCYEIHFINLFWNDEKNKANKKTPLKNCSPLSHAQRSTRSHWIECHTHFFAHILFAARSIVHQKLCTHQNIIYLREIEINDVLLYNKFMIL